MKVKNSRILLPRVRFYAHHGVDPQEQLTGAYFHVGIEADTDFNEAMQTDRLEGTVSYADLYEVSRRKWTSLQNYWNTWREESFKDSSTTSLPSAASV